jgi:hypothetical protein
MPIQLFLAHADSQKPVLRGGLDLAAARAAEKPGHSPPDPSHLADRSASPDALPLQRWGIVAPKGAVGERLLQLVAPLKQRREEEQGAPAVVYRVDPAMGFGAANAWIQQDYWDAVRRRETDLPRYLLILGGPDLVSWELQQMLGCESFVGRLAFDDEHGYAAYVEKVLRWADETAVEEGARALFYTARDGSGATEEGYARLVVPSLQVAEDSWTEAREILAIGGDAQTDKAIREGAQRMLREAGQSRGGLLFSLSHGAGAPADGWPSPADQRASQGAIVLGTEDGKLLTAREVGAQPFLPGGAWFIFACFSAGTPSRSTYEPWISRLHALGLADEADGLLTSLPRAGEPPFVAALPQAVLASPAGPLGVIGHVDLAWTWSFVDQEYDGKQVSVRSRAERFQGVLASLVQGHRIGVAHHALARCLGTVDQELLAMYAAAAEGGAAPAAEQADAWMQRQDLCAYVLLGDPAARLPIALRPDGVPPPRPARTAAAAPSATKPVSAQAMEDAVMAVLRGGDPGAIAAQRGIAEDALKRWTQAFLDAGRAALKGL